MGVAYAAFAGVGGVAARTRREREQSAGAVRTLVPVTGLQQPLGVLHKQY
jgi:hypothetical protein